MAVEAKYDLKLSVDEGLTLGLDFAGDPEITHDIGSVTGTLKAGTTPAASKCWSGSISLVAGAGSIDLTSLARNLLTPANFTALKIRILKASCPSTNAAAVTITRGATNAYNLFGPTNATADRVTLAPGTAVELYWSDEAETVDATHRNVDFSGTGTDKIDIVLVAG